MSEDLAQNRVPCPVDSDGHALHVLEFLKILDLVALKTRSVGGEEKIQHLRPQYDPKWISNRQIQVATIQGTLADSGMNWPLDEIHPIRPLLRDSQRPGGQLDGSQLRLVAATLQTAGRMRKFLDRNSDLLADLQEPARALTTHQEVVLAIHRAVSEAGEILDVASPELRRIRRSLQQKRQAVLSELEHMMGEAQSADDYVTMRGDRYVIPTRGETSNKIKGIVHDRSASKATLFVEPFEVVELNNELQGLRDAEVREIHRILVELTKRVAEEASAILASLEVLEELDALHASASFAKDVDATRPNVGSPLKLKGARHPLLVDKFRGTTTRVVPLDLSLEGTSALVITGPNTGGKTVALKSVGLLVLMHQAGIPIPCLPESQLPIFKNIVADIGDEQSIAQSESTFSSHLRHVVRALKMASETSLVLLDEFMAGTDPEDGAALAKVVLQRLVQARSTVLVTTHLGALKVFAHSEPRIANAAMQFDDRSGSPIYILETGIPGSSKALEIAALYGMPADILKDAHKQRGKIAGQVEAALTAMEKARLKSEESGKRADAAHQEATRVHDEHQKLIADLQKNKKQYDRQAKAQATRIVEEAQSQIERVVRELRESQASRATIQRARQTIEKLKARAAPEPPNAPASADLTTLPQEGETVFVRSLNREGTLEKILSPKKVHVLCGNMRFTVPMGDLGRLSTDSSGAAPGGNPLGGSEVISGSSFSQEIDVRGLFPDEAVEAVDRFLDQVLLNGGHEAQIIHGKGTGALRHHIARFLANHPQVAETRLGEHFEGGSGVTIARLR